MFEFNNNIRYRVLNPLDALERRGHQIVFGRRGPTGPLDLAALRDCDVIHAYRLLEPADWRAVQNLVRGGAALVWDTDDDLSNVPRETAYYRRRGGLAARRETARTTLAMARAAHVVTTSTEPIAEWYRRHGVERVVVLENLLAPGEARMRRRKHDGVVIGWIAGGEHAADLARIPLVAALEEVLEARPTVRVETLGLRLDLDHGRYRHIPPVTMERFLDVAKGWDIGLAPLADIPFNRARSDVKLKEYASLGIPWLASPVGPYASHGARQGGELVADDDWATALLRLVDRRVLRFRASRRGRRWARTMIVDRAVTSWETALSTAQEIRDGQGDRQPMLR